MTIAIRRGEARAGSFIWVGFASVSGLSIIITIHCVEFLDWIAWLSSPLDGRRMVFFGGGCVAYYYHTGNTLYLSMVGSGRCAVLSSQLSRIVDNSLRVI